MTQSSFPHFYLPTFISADCLGKILTIALLACLLPLAEKCLAQNNNSVVARIEGKEIWQQDLDESLASQIYSLEQQLFALRKAALNNLITGRILEAEASRKHLTVSELKNNWMAGPLNVSGAQVDDLYHKNRQAFGLMNPDEAKEKIRLDLENQIKLQRYREQLEALRQTLKIEVLLPQPRLKIMSTSDRSAAKGPADGPVVITEFSDFQCPYCREVQPTLNKILQLYPKQVRLEFRHLPLEIHSLSQTASRAAYCAGKQNAFWEFHDLLFGAPELTNEKIKEFAHVLNLDEDRFAGCWSSQESQAAIARDLQEAQRLGFDGTPTFLINGRLLQGAISFDDFDKAVLNELGSSPMKNSTSPN